MSPKTLKLQDYLDKQLADPNFKKEWESSSVQYEIVKEIIATRIKLNISQRELAKRAKTTQAVISRIESMSVNPSIGLIERVAKAMNKKLEISFI